MSGTNPYPPPRPVGPYATGAGGPAPGGPTPGGLGAGGAMSGEYRSDPSVQPASPRGTPPSGTAAGATGPGRHPEHSPPAQDRRRRRRRSGGIVKFVSDKAIPLLIAVLGLLAALATAWGATKSADVNDLQESEVSLERTVTSLAEEKASLEAQVSELEAELAGAEPAVPPGEDEPGGSVPPVTSGPSSQPATVLRETGGTPLTFSSGYSIDLDSNAPNWDVSDSGGDLSFFYGSTTGAHLGTREVSMVDHVPTKQECDDATVLLASLPEEQTRDGVQFCMRSNDERTTYVHVVDINEEAETVTLDIVVWE